MDLLALYFIIILHSILGILNYMDIVDRKRENKIVPPIGWLLWFWIIGLVWFLGISTFVGYLMPKPFSKKNSSGTI